MLGCIQTSGLQRSYRLRRTFCRPPESLGGRGPHVQRTPGCSLSISSRCLWFWFCWKAFWKGWFLCDIEMLNSCSHGILPDWVNWLFSGLNRIFPSVQCNSGKSRVWTQFRNQLSLEVSQQRRSNPRDELCIRSQVNPPCSQNGSAGYGHHRLLWYWRELKHEDSLQTWSLFLDCMCSFIVIVPRCVWLCRWSLAGGGAWWEAEPVGSRAWWEAGPDRWWSNRWSVCVCVCGLSGRSCGRWRRPAGGGAGRSGCQDKPSWATSPPLEACCASGSESLRSGSCCWSPAGAGGHSEHEWVIMSSAVQLLQTALLRLL